MIDVLIVDDHAVVRKGIMQILAALDEPGTLDEAGSGREALNKIDDNKYDLVLLDVALPNENGFQVLKDIRHRLPQMPVLILSMYGEETYGVRAKIAGASGYITKDETPEKLIDAVSAILSGETYFSEAINDRLFLQSASAQTKTPHNRLSTREFEIMCLLAKGNRVKEIADKLCISVKTVSTHRRHILEKMDMDNNAEMTEYAILEGLL